MRRRLKRHWRETGGKERRNVMGERAGGQVTVFISMIMMCMFAFFCVLLESARTAGARWYLQTAASSALDSVFSQYHRQLWDAYRLLFAEYDGAEGVEADFSAFLQPYLETDNWYPMELDFASAENLLRATDEEGVYFEQEILDYRKFGVWNLDFDASTVDSLWDSAREAAAVKDVAETYRGHAKEALKLEKSLEAVSESLKAQGEKKKEGMSYLRSYDGPGFRRTAEKLIRELERMPGLVETYQRRADELARGLEKSRTEYEGKRQECSQQVQQLLEEEIREYEAYVAADGQRRQEIEALKPLSEEQVRMVQEVIAEAREVERIIDEWEDDDDDDEGPDLDSLWRPVERHFGRLEIRALSFAHGVKDKEKEGWLNQVEAMYRSGLLALVVPEGTEVSEQRANLMEAPSEDEGMSENGRSIGFLDHLLVNEYCGDFLRNFLSGKEEENLQSEGSGGPEKTVLSYEVEYLLGGRDTDEGNLTDVIQRLLAVREGLNFVHILSDPGKRAEARNLAAVVTGAAAATPLLLVAAFFIMSVWALGEALMDIKGLLAGRRVPLLKSGEDWSLKLENLLTMGKSREVGTGGGEQGLNYLSWLKILLFMEKIVPQEYRMMDLMQMNLMLQQSSFRMRRGVYQVEINGQLCGKHVFFSLGFVEKLLGESDHVYPMKVKVKRVY